MPEISIKDQTKRLIELQRLDEEIYAKKRDLKEKPAHIEVLKEQFESSKAHLNSLEDALKQVQVQRKDIELELLSKEELITKANAALNEIKTNKEYTAKLTEIESLKADKSVLEEKILKSYDESDGVNKEMEDEKAIVVQKEKEFQTQKKEVEEEVKVIEDRIHVLESQRKQMLPEIDSSILAVYEKVLENKQGRAIVPLEGTSCGACYMNVTAQTVNLIKMHTEMVLCDQCQCILYIKDDIEA